MLNARMVGAVGLSTRSWVEAREGAGGQAMRQCHSTTATTQAPARSVRALRYKLLASARNHRMRPANPMVPAGGGSNRGHG